MINLLLFLIIGFVEWLMASLRTRLAMRALQAKIQKIRQRKALLASFLVFLETVLGLWVFLQYVDGNRLVGIAYALGGSIGFYLGLIYGELPRAKATGLPAS